MTVTDEEALAALHSLRVWAIRRVCFGRDVQWFDGDMMRHAESWPSKYDGAWRISCERCEYYRDRDWVLSELTSAQAIVVP